jgi:hypothetical protein
VENVDVGLLKNTYRENGWTGIQLIHHCADRHMNSFIRFKLALTEDNPTIKPYEEESWANTADGLDINLIPSLSLIEALHYRWTFLMRSLNQKQLDRTFYHPAQEKTITIKEAIHLYAWHSKHHLAHLKILLLA